MEKIDNFSEQKREPREAAKDKLSGIEHGVSLEIKRALRKTIKNSDVRSILDRSEISRITEQVKDVIQKAWQEGENKTKRE